ncbi:hypothetical protein N7472_010746, partial [Penicillium cf. griseofulvum]
PCIKSRYTNAINLSSANFDLPRDPDCLTVWSPLPQSMRTKGNSSTRARFVKSCHVATRKLLAYLFSRQNEKKLHITSTELNLITGDANDYGPCLMKPFPRHKMREYVNREHPWNKFDIHGLNVTDTPEFNHLGSIYRNQRQWKLEGWKDTSHPHIKAHIADSQPHLVNRLNTVRNLPIWHDKQNPEALQVRSSQIVNFTDGIQNNLDDWVTIMCRDERGLY